MFTPDGTAEDLVAACRQYEARLQVPGGVDLQVLGIGANGHIGFNEPGSSLASLTRVKTLTEQTRTDNARFFGDDLSAVPRHCLTQGLGTIMQARHCLLVAKGEAKAEAVAHLVEGAVSARWPASVLQHHPHCTVLLDEDCRGRAGAGRVLPVLVAAQAALAEALSARATLTRARHRDACARE